MKFDSTRRLGKTSNGQKQQGFGRFSILMCGSLLLGGAMQPALAEHDQPTFREFREQNSNLDRREIRQLFRATYNNRSTAGASQPLHITPKVDSINASNPHHVIFNDNSANRINHREAKLLRGGMQQIGDDVVRLRSGVALDLSSADKNIVLGENLFKSVGSIEITVGNEKQTFAAGSKATAAEYIAIKQALSSNSGQQLLIDQSGIASGGSVDLTQITADNDPMRASSLTVASGVTTYGDFNKRSDFRLTGDLNNYGTVVALSTSNAVRGGAIRAQDITNNEGATITSVRPEALRNSSAARVDLTLDARGDLSNYGSITSSGDLTLLGGNSVTNSGTVSAAESVNISAPNLNNSGNIAAEKGNVNIDGPATAALNVTNTGGTISALHGAINVRTPEYNGTFNNNIIGGDLLSKELNLHAGQATNNVDVNNLTGTISQTGLAGHVLASTDELIIGSTCLTGDPTFYNAKGSILINGNLSVGEKLTIIASGNIVKASLTNIEARSATGGFDITFIAGANFVSTTGTPSPTVPGAGGGSVTLDGTGSGATGTGTGPGGLIQFGTGSVITSPTAGGTGNGGNVSFYAFNNTGKGSGMVDVNAASIVTGGVGTGSNGNVVIVAGGDDDLAGPIPLGRAIQIGVINTTGGTGGGGDLTITTAQPTSSGGNITYNADGSLAPGAFLTAGTINAAGSIGQATGKATIARDAFLTAGKDIVQASNLDTLFTSSFDSNVTLTAGGDIGGGTSFPFIIEGFNGRITKRVNGGSAGNNQLTVNATGAASKVNILRNAVTTLNLMNSTTTKDLVIRTNSILNVAGNITSTGGKVQLENTGGALNINPGISIIAFDAIDIANGSRKRPSMLIGTNAVLQTTAVGGASVGSIFLTVDSNAFLNAVREASVAGQGPGQPSLSSNVRTQQLDSLENAFVGVSGTTPEKAEYGGRPPSFQGPINNFTSKNASILLTSTRNKSMTFGGGVNVIAGQ
jgi:hypothetical protein